MFSRFVTLVLLSIFCSSSQAQTNLYLKVNQKLGTNSFSGRPIVDLPGLNGSSRFILTRMEFYISGIEIIHDDGQKTPLLNKYILVSNLDTTYELLGNLNIQQVEGISFYIGVDSLTNHSDPTNFSSPHPLALKFPSMHWGWASGYRFVAFEAGTGSNFNTLSSIHALGDQNYLKQTHAVGASKFGGDLVINLDADYLAALTGITVDENLFYHGEGDDARVLLENFRDYVFSATTVGLDQKYSINQEISIYPNPSEGTIQLSNFSNLKMNYALRDLSGKLHLRGNLNPRSNTELIISKSGVYFLQLSSEAGDVATRKIVIQ